MQRVKDEFAKVCFYTPNLFHICYQCSIFNKLFVLRPPIPAARTNFLLYLKRDIDPRVIMYYADLYPN